MTNNVFDFSDAPSSSDFSTLLPAGSPLTAPLHGADLAAASRRYGIPIGDWLDLSTGINPRAYPIGVIESELFQDLPHGLDVLTDAAKNYCAAPATPVVASGSQVLIQWLPLVCSQIKQRRCRIAVPSIGYSEHAFRWRWAGHEIIYYDPREPTSIDTLLRRESIDVLIVINAHNPLGLIIAPARLLAWHALLAEKGGWLIVDEAFIDPTPESSVVAHTDLTGLIVLRSLGKFFGLAGVRCGYAFCAAPIADYLRVAVGPWAVSGPTVKIATTALRDAAWQQAIRSELPKISAANSALLQQADWAVGKKILPHHLFNSIEFSPSAALTIEAMFAQRAIRVRRIEVNAELSLLRWGLIDPADNEQWARVEQVVRF